MCRPDAADEAISAIFVKHLPANVTPDKLFNTFQQYGTIRGGLKGVSLRNTKSSGSSLPGREDKPRDVVAFIEFTEPAAMQAAIAASVFIDDQKVVGSCIWLRNMIGTITRSACWQSIQTIDTQIPRPLASV